MVVGKSIFVTENEAIALDLTDNLARLNISMSFLFYRLPWIRFMVPRHFLGFVFFLSLFVAFSTADAQKKPKVEIPEPERVLLETKDKIELRADWYAGTAGKEAVPVILIHDWDGDRSNMSKLALSLQDKLGCAVIAPDLRGHGESLVVKGSSEDIDRKRFKKNELLTFVEDIDTCRKFLQGKNDDGELNLDMLVIVASGKMTIPAIDWTISDWSWPPLNGVKQGQNVKSLILVSPRKRFKSLSSTQSLKAPIFTSRTKALPSLLVWGKSSSSAKDGEAIYKMLQKARKEPEKFDDADDRWNRQTLFKIEYDSGSDGDDLIADRAQQIFKAVSIFIDKKIIANKDEFSWQNRKLD